MRELQRVGQKEHIQFLRQKHTTTNSEEWFNKQILPNIPQNLVIILDNATYHNKQKDKPPTAASRKKGKKKVGQPHKREGNQEDVTGKGMPASTEATVLMDEAAEYHRHVVLSVKGDVAKQNENFNLKENEQLTPEGFTHTARNYCRLVVDIENKQYIEEEEIIEDTVEEKRIEFGEEGDSDDDSDGDETN